MPNCENCNAENVFYLFSDGNDQITAKLVKSDRGSPFVDIMIRDGYYKFQNAWIDAYEFDDFIRRLLSMRKHVKEWGKDTDV